MSHHGSKSSMLLCGLTRGTGTFTLLSEDVTIGFRARGLERYKGFQSLTPGFMRYAMERQSHRDTLAADGYHQQIQWVFASLSNLERDRAAHHVTLHLQLDPTCSYEEDFAPEGWLPWGIDTYIALVSPSLDLSDYVWYLGCDALRDGAHPCRGFQGLSSAIICSLDYLSYLEGSYTDVPGDSGWVEWCYYRVSKVWQEPAVTSQSWEDS
jgi:hypothetical protein